MDLYDLYFRQKITEGEFDDILAAVQQADWNQFTDINVIGVISGGVVSEHSPTPDLTVDATAPMTSYDQLGRRIYISGSGENVDCSEDEDGNPTTVVGAGNKKWLMLTAEFQRTLTDARVDGNGNTVYYDQAESFELAIVQGTEAGGGGHAKPAAPSDRLILADIELSYGDTQIFNAAIYTTRRQDFTIFSASQIPVSSGSWTFLNGASLDTVQSVLDFIDIRILELDSAHEVQEDIIPDGDGTRALGSVAKSWDVFAEDLSVAQLITNMHPDATGTRALGETSTPRRYSLLAVESVDFIGDLKPGAAARVDGDLIPKTDSSHDLGAVTPLRWANAFIDVVDVLVDLKMDAAARVDGHLIPKAATNDLGDASNPWDEIRGDDFICHKSTITSAFAMSAAEEVTRGQDISMATPENDDYTEWLYRHALSVDSGNRNVWHTSSGSAVLVAPLNRIFHGSVLQTIKVSWMEAGGTADFKVQLWRVTHSTGAPGQIGSNATITAAGSWQSLQSVWSSIGHTIDLATYRYELRFYTTTAVDQYVGSVLCAMDVTDIGRAATS